MDLVKKIRMVTETECDKMKYLNSAEDLIGMCNFVFDKCGVPRVNPIPEDYFDSFIEGFMYSFYDGIEPEFETEEQEERFYKSFQKLKSCEYITEKYDSRGNKLKPYCPYIDKTIPFLAPRVSNI